MENLHNFTDSIAPLFKSVWMQMALLIVFATVHGYAGAWLAVRMLFRPRRAFRLFGITLFPQGMIPRHRERLANAIGKAVGEELVSQETIMQELIEKDFLKTKILGIVDSYTRQIFSNTYPSLIESLPATLRAPVLDAITALQFSIAEHIEITLKAQSTHDAISQFVSRRVDDFLSRRLSSVVDDGAFEQFANILTDRIEAALNSREFEQNVRSFINRRIDDLVTLQTPLSELFTQEAVALIKEKSFEQISPITHRLTEIAAEEKTRGQIGALIKREVHEYYENLPFFKKIFVSRENLLREVDDLVNESLPRRIEEMLKGDVFAEQARDFVAAAIDNAMQRPITELIGKIAPEKLENVKRQIGNAVIKILRSPEIKSSIRTYITETIGRLKPHSLDSILRTITPGTESQIKEILSRTIINIVSGDNTVRLINDLISKQIENLLSRPIGRLSDKIEEEKIITAGETLASAVIAAIREKLPEAIKEFDLGSVVRTKIMNYPVEKLEELVLSVAKEHLRKIEFFGALFGFLIGLVQAVQFYFYSR